MLTYSTILRLKKQWQKKFAYIALPMELQVYESKTRGVQPTISHFLKRIWASTMLIDKLLVA